MKSFKEVIKESKPTLVVFMKAGNQDAVEVKYLVGDIEKKYGDKMSVMRVDASFHGYLAEDYKLSGYPTWILFKEGQELMRRSGRNDFAEISEMLETAL